MNKHLTYIVTRSIAAGLPLCAISVPGQQIPLPALVTPSTVITKDGRAIAFALHGFIEFQSLGELFPCIESQSTHWKALPRGHQFHPARNPAFPLSQ
jgi:hypothetical protein